jgi:hypothetical protein
MTVAVILRDLKNPTNAQLELRQLVPMRGFRSAGLTLSESVTFTVKVTMLDPEVIVGSTRPTGRISRGKDLNLETVIHYRQLVGHSLEVGKTITVQKDMRGSDALRG